MRCPKCGFISFDHFTSCAKCGRDVSEVAAELQGTSIKVESPMYLSGALAAFSESGASFEDHDMDADVDQGIDFDMEMEAEADEPLVMAGAEEEVDFSFEEEAGEVGAAAEPEISFAEPGADDAVGIELEAEVEEESEAHAAEDSFEELDFLGPVDEEEEGGLEFDLEDFMEDIDEKKSTYPGSGDTEDIDIDLADEDK